MCSTAMGHGALVYEPDAPAAGADRDRSVVVTGPRRAMLHGSKLQPYFAVPFGDMMIAGCFGLLSAAADLLPDPRRLKFTPRCLEAPSRHHPGNSSLRLFPFAQFAGSARKIPPGLPNIDQVEVEQHFWTQGFK